MDYDWFGITLFHHLGIIGSLLMLSGMSYSFKKRWNRPMGSTPFWLKYHEIASVFGALLVIIHADGSFGGLAGVSIVMMTVVSVSGFLGHYIYTRIPRNSMGKEKELTELKKELDRIKEDMNNEPGLKTDERHYEKLSGKAKRLEKQIGQLDTARKLLSGWRAWHIPMTAIFLIIVVVHIISTLYYGNYMG